MTQVLIIAGPRDLAVDDAKLTEILTGFGLQNISEIVSGGSSGIDECGELWADAHSKIKTVIEARWDDFTLPRVTKKLAPSGKKYYNAAAGPLRNKEMAQYVRAKDPQGACLIIRRAGPISSGTNDMRKTAYGLLPRVCEYVVRPNEESKKKIKPRYKSIPSTGHPQVRADQR
jgi:hypothetical protein